MRSIDSLADIIGKPRFFDKAVKKNALSLEETKKKFQSLSDTLNRNNLTIDVFMWTDDFHDRYLISDLVGILLSNGFNYKNGQKTTWARLSRQHRQEIEEEFDPAVRKPMHQFQVP